MKKLMDIGTVYLSRCELKDMAFLKLCVCALGVMLGLSVPAKHKKCYFMWAALVFMITLVPLMLKMMAVMKETCCCSEEAAE